MNYKAYCCLAGLKATMDSIDNRGDFKTYMQNYTVAFNSGSVGAGTISGRILRREGPWEEGFVSTPFFSCTNSPRRRI